MANILVVGCGSIGKRHVGNLIHLGVTDLVAYDVEVDRREEMASRFGIRVLADLDAALDTGITAVLVCSPTSLHVEHVLRVVRANCHVFVEKPLSDTLEGTADVCHEIERRNLTALVACNYRFHVVLRKVRELLQAETIGTIVSVTARFGQYLPEWRPRDDYRQSYSAKRGLGGGVILDRIHEFDYLQWLFGQVEEVYALTGRLSHLDIDTEDTAEVLLRFRSGHFGSIHLDYVRRTYNCSLEVIGELGTIECRFQDSRLRWYSAAEGLWRAMHWPRYEVNDMYVDELRHFLGCLAGQEQPEQDVEESRRVLATALAAKHSGRERKPVRVQDLLG